MLGLSVGMIIACLSAVFVGATVQASIGIGVGMIAAPVLAVADPAFIPASIVLSVLPLTFAVAWADRTHIERRGVGFALLGRLPGVVVGAAIVAVLSDQVLAVMVAVSVLIAVLASVTSTRFSRSDGHLFVAGLASGFTGTATGVGGPPMALTYQHADPAVMRSTISAFFTVGSMMSIVALATAGEVGRRQVQLAALLLPAIAAGVVTARLIKDRLDPTRVRPAVLIICTTAAVLLLAETL
jgi:uncharacterized membrane protein YfcA